jgi:hypothetical protein
MSAAIDLALREHLAAFGLPVSWEGDKFTPPATTWVQARMFPVDGVRQTHSGTMRRNDFFQVTVMHPLAEKGASLAAKRIADQIVSHFATDMRLPVSAPVLRIRRQPDIAQGFPDGAWWRLPVTIYITAFT